ncbi:MAG TPA: hypothetical protein VIS48_03620 [Candidatus Kryptonia bacterium]
MKNIDRDLQNPRGSSPPFQEIETWIDDGANGIHWVRTNITETRAQVSRCRDSDDTKNIERMDVKSNRDGS